MSNKAIVIWVSLLVGLPLFGYTLSTIKFNRVWDIVSRIQPAYLGVYFLLSIFGLIILTVIWLLFLRSQKDFSISPVKLFNYRMAGYAISYLTPGPRVGGEATRGSLISRDTPLSTKEGTLAGFMEDFCLLISGLIFDTAAVIAAFMILPENWLIQTTLSGLIIIGAIIAIIWYFFVISSGTQKIINWLAVQMDQPEYIKSNNETSETRQYLKNNTDTLAVGSGLGLVQKIMIVFQIYFLLIGLQTPVTLLEAAFLAAALDIAYAIPTYMGLGALEAGQTGLLRLIVGRSSEGAGVLTAFITRIRDIIFSGYGLLALSYYSTETHRNKQATD
jgi:uncharacterized protein (TIRG00374 family)